MSPPDTNIQTQKHRHRASLIGMLAAIVLTATVATALVVFTNIPADEQAMSDSTPATGSGTATEAPQ